MAGWADPRVVGDSAVTQGLHVRTILGDPRAELVGSADGPVTGDDHVDVVRHALEQAQRGEVVVERVRSVQVEERHQDVGQHVAGDENAASSMSSAAWPGACARCSMIRT